MQRRTLLQLLGVGTGLGAARLSAGSRAGGSLTAGTDAMGAAAPGPPSPARLPASVLPLPLAHDSRSAAEQRRQLARVAVQDRVVVPEGYRAELVAVWGDPLASGRFGFNNDYLALLELGDRALLSVNFEYISPLPWASGFEEATGQPLPLAQLRTSLADRGGQVDVGQLSSDDPLRPLVLAVAEAAMADLGIGVLELQRSAGHWRRQPGSRFERRITGLTGLQQPELALRCTGPAAAVFANPKPLGYADGLGERIVGTFANCAGGTTPWGTVLSAEENFQSQVSEAVFADGSAAPPAERPFRWDGSRLDGLGNPFGLAGNKYGWMVEFDPQRPEQPALKHSWLGRFRHEAVAVQVRAGQPLVVYSGCDRHGGHLYRFVSNGVIGDPRDRANSRLLEQGRLEVARFAPDGTGHWIALTPTTPLAPQWPSHYSRFGFEQPTLLPHSDRRRSGAEALTTDDAVAAYCQRYVTLGELYTSQGAILVDAHLAANAVGATPAARPEDTVIDPRNGDLLIAFTAAGRNEEGSSDPAIFRGPGGEIHWPHGWVMRLSDGGSTPDSRFRWEMVATGGTPWQGGLGFSNPDNLAFDPAGNLWMVTDRSTSGSLDVFGNNSCWLLPRSGPGAGEALCFAIGPMECELCGPCFDATGHTLFLAVQHPGEVHGTRQGQASEWQAHQLVDRDGQPFEQLRQVPLGSNWPSGVPGRPPRPGVVAIRRLDGGVLNGVLSPSPPE
jgi:secreted PhoX family phosphatase